MDYSDLNAEQYAAATYSGRHLLVMAGAGTGKTRTIIARAKFLIDTGVPPSKIVILSFTRKSAQDIVDRIQSQLDPEKTAGLKGMTFHSWCLEILTEFKDDFGMDGYSLLNEDDQATCRSIIESQVGMWKMGRLVGEAYSYSVNAMCSLGEAMAEMRRAHIDDVEGYRRFIDAYIEYKRSHKYLDFDDLLSLVSLAMKENAVLRKKIASRYEHILIDEMQDTNPLQYSLLNSFKDDCNLFCVGDEAQSIYGFRGADFGSIHHFTEKFDGAEVLPLSRSYRSTQEILDLADWMLGRSSLGYNKHLVADRGAGRVPVIITGEHHESLVRHLIADIRDNVETCGYGYRDNMILARATFQLRDIEGALVKEGIPYVLRGGISYLKQRHIRMLLSPLRIVANHRDEFAWNDYLSTSGWEVQEGGLRMNPKWMNPEIAAAVISKATFDEALSALYDYSVPQHIVEPLLAVRASLDSPVDALAAARKSLEPILRVNRDFDILADIASGCSSIARFVSDYVLDPRIADRNEEDGDCVIVSTIHSAKGLECSNCYLWDIDAMNWPKKTEMMVGKDGGEEERRLLYVAMTRAKDKLMIYRHSFDERQACPGYFLKDVPESLAELENL